MSVSEETMSIADHLIESAPADEDIASTAPTVKYEVVIEPKPGWRLIDWKEFYEYRDLFRFLIWRSIKVQYAQSTLGVGWAIIQPLFSMVIFTVVFGKLAGVESDGVPYAVFSFAALMPWTYFANALTEGTNSLVGNTNMLRKVYFPRMMLPLSAVFAKLIDFAIASVILTGLMAWYGVAPNVGVLMLPFLVCLMILTAAGLGMWLTALAVHYRDVKHAMSFIVQILMYCAPVVYPASLIPWTYHWGDIVLYPRLIYSLNPMVGVIEGFRSALLGTTPMPWSLLAIGTLSAIVIAVSGCLFFRRKERLFADVA
jgi:lipopolysaccharide transport system permease protein